MATEATGNEKAGNENVNADVSTAGGELVRFEKVVKRFGGNTVLDQLDFTVEAGKPVRVTDVLPAVEQQLDRVLAQGVVA